MPPRYDTGREPHPLGQRGWGQGCGVGLTLLRAGHKGSCRGTQGSDALLAHPLPGLLQMKELQLVLSEANESLRGLQEQLSQERQLRKDEVDNFSQKICQVSR